MKIPKGMTEQEVIDTINKVARGLSHKYRFGYHGVEDIQQDAWEFGIKGLDHYDKKKGTLETFLWTHIRNQLYNQKRNKFERPKPCKTCPFNAYDPDLQNSSSGCTKYDDKMGCDLYASWYKRNSCKKNIMTPITIENVQDEKEESMKLQDIIGDAIDFNYIVNTINDNIGIEYRANWIKLKNGIKLKRPDHVKLIGHIQQILEKHDIRDSE